jgi:hypothetical protein
MSEPRRCDSCFHSIRCQWLLGDSYNPAGPCDWNPSRWKLGVARICPECGFKYGHNLGCQYVADEKRRMNHQAEKMHRECMDEITRR